MPVNGPPVREVAERFARYASVLVAAAATLLLATPARADLTACIAASEQALSLRHAGKLREARKQLALCGATACPEELRVECNKRMDSLNAAMPGLVVGAKDGSGSDLTHVEVAIDGVRVATTLDGRPFEVDPGAHVVRVSAAGLPSVERKVVLGEGEKTRYETFVIGAVPLVVTPAASDRPGDGTHGRWGTQRTLAVVSGSVGLAGLGAGAVFGVLASSEWSSAKNAVTAQASCTSAPSCAAHTTAENDHDTATTYATVSTVALGVGAALVVTGVVAWLTGPAHTDSGASRTGQTSFVLAGIPGGAALTVLGEF